MLVVCTTVFTLAWIPYHTLQLVMDLFPDLTMDVSLFSKLWLISHWLAMSHTCHNPFIYIWLNNDFKDGYNRCFHKITCYICHSDTKNRTDQMEELTIRGSMALGLAITSQPRFIHRTKLSNGEQCRRNHHGVYFNKTIC